MRTSWGTAVVMTGCAVLFAAASAAPLRAGGQAAAAKISVETHEGYMKTLSSANAALGMKIMSNDLPGAAKDAQQIAATFADIEKFWSQNNKSDGVMWSSRGGRTRSTWRPRSRLAMLRRPQRRARRCREVARRATWHTAKAVLRPAVTPSRPESSLHKPTRLCAHHRIAIGVCVDRRDTFRVGLRACPERRTGRYVPRCARWMAVMTSRTNAVGSHAFGYRVRPNRTMTRFADGIIVTNWPAWPMA